MSYTSFSIGRDTQLVVIGPSGRVDLTHVTGFEARQLTHSVRVDRLDGTTLGTELPKGWEGMFELERGSSVVDDFIASAEQQYFNGSVSTPSTMYQYVNETDGSVSTYEYDTVTFKLASAGQWRGDSSVKQRLEFFAARRRRI
jgi:hypothetical protein